MQGLAGAARKEDQQRDRSLRGAEDRPIGGARPLQAGMNHVLWPVRLVGLRNEAAAAVEQVD